LKLGVNISKLSRQPYDHPTGPESLPAETSL
jgi:hypothetical protein